jgi:hypothetical protein
MAYKRFLLVLLAAALVFGLTVVGCSNGSTDNRLPATNGRLTITGLESYNGKYAYAITSGYDYDSELFLMAAETTGAGTGGPGRINDGSVTLKVWRADGAAQKAFVYSGNDQNVRFMVMIYNSTTPYAEIAAAGYVTVNFTNGIATGECTDITANPYP